MTAGGKGKSTVHPVSARHAVRFSGLLGHNSCQEQRVEIVRHAAQQQSTQALRFDAIAALIRSQSVFHRLRKTYGYGAPRRRR